MQIRTTFKTTHKTIEPIFCYNPLGWSHSQIFTRSITIRDDFEPTLFRNRVIIGVEDPFYRVEKRELISPPIDGWAACGTDPVRIIGTIDNETTAWSSGKGGCVGALLRPAAFHSCRLPAGRLERRSRNCVYNTSGEVRHW